MQTENAPLDSRTINWVSATMAPVYLVFVSLLVFRTRSFAEATGTGFDITTAHKVVALALALILTGYALASRGFPRRWSLPLKLFGCYALVGLFSTHRSGHLAYSIWKVLEVLCVLLVALVALRLSQDRPRIALACWKAWLAYLQFLVVVTIAGAVLVPSEALRLPVTEETIEAFGKPLLPVQLYGVLIQVNPNTLGAAAATLLFVEIARISEGAARMSVAALIRAGAFAAVLVVAQSRTAWIGFVAAIGAIVLLSNRRRIGAKILVGCALVGVAVFSADYAIAYFTRGASTEHLSRLSGRSAWWAAAVHEVFSSDLGGVLFGLGFMSANRTILSEIVGTDASTLHSDYVDALVSTGVTGTLFLVAAVASLMLRLFRLLMKRVPSVHVIELFGVMLILASRSFTGTTFSSHNHLLLGFVFAGVLCRVIEQSLAAGPSPYPSRVLAPGAASSLTGNSTTHQ